MVGAALQVPVQELGIAAQRTEVADDGRLRAAHVVHQDDGVSHVVQVHGHRQLNEAAQAGAPALAGLGHFQIFAKVGRQQLTTVWDSVGQEQEVKSISVTQTQRCCTLSVPK